MREKAGRSTLVSFGEALQPTPLGLSLTEKKLVICEPRNMNTVQSCVYQQFVKFKSADLREKDKFSNSTTRSQTR